MDGSQAAGGFRARVAFDLFDDLPLHGDPLDDRHRRNDKRGRREGAHEVDGLDWAPEVFRQRRVRVADVEIGVGRLLLFDGRADAPMRFNLRQKPE